MQFNWRSARNLIGFWLFGLCNNYAYVIMLSAAEDIMNKQQHKNTTAEDANSCEAELTTRHCSTVSAGAVLLADIIPSMIVKLTFPFFMHRIPFGIRHFFVIILQALSYIVVAFSAGVGVSLLGINMGSGLGEITFLALSSHFSNNAVSAWSSGTGGAGIFGSLAYAGLTEPHLANLSPKTALLIMLVVPAIFAIAFWIMVIIPETVHRVHLLKPKTYIVPKNRDEEKAKPAFNDEITTSYTTVIAVENRPFKAKLRLILPLLRYMIPLSTVYFGEYLINQGIVELIFFDCSHGWHLSRPSQYRWYQVLYQLGVFISRSSVNLIEIPVILLPLLAILQLCNAVFFFFNAIYFFVPHIAIVFGIILFEGFLGGASYVNTFHAIHKKVSPDVREFSLAVASSADSFGIVLSGFLAIPGHNFVCKQPLHNR